MGIIWWYNCMVPLIVCTFATSSQWNHQLKPVCGKYELEPPSEIHYLCVPSKFMPSSLKATLPTKHEFLSSQRIFHPLLILQVVSTSLKLRLLLASLRCRRCLLTPCNEISMWKKCSGTPGIDPYQNFQSIVSIKLSRRVRVVMY